MSDTNTLATVAEHASRRVRQETLLEAGALPIAQLARLARREGQASKPVYRLHRWFARRLGSQFRAILTALTLGPEEGDRFWDRYFGHIPLDGLIILDPFVGGGTSIAEAARCGARVIGGDIDPVASLIARVGLQVSSYEGYSSNIQQMLDGVKRQIAPYHTSVLPDGRTVRVLHHFWVETIDCPICERGVQLHPHYELAHDQAKGKRWAFCRVCLEVQGLSINRKRLDCECGVRTRIDKGTIRYGRVWCPHCRNDFRLLDTRKADRQPRWLLFAQEYLDGTGARPRRVFKTATDDDRLLYQAAADEFTALEASGDTVVPSRPIPAVGRWDQRPLVHGITQYRDLFNNRQLFHLSSLASEIQGVTPDWMRLVLGLAFSEHLAANCMYTGYAFGYRRTSPLFSIHGYRHVVRPVELNPWLLGTGRGTFPNALEKIRKAGVFAREPREMHPEGGTKTNEDTFGVEGPVSHDLGDVLHGRARAAVRTANSEDLGALPDCSVDVILTDPPYFDNVSYSELSDFYLAWHQVLGIADSQYRNCVKAAPIEESLAVSESAASQEYARRLTQIVSECHRVLRSDGLLVFTYHHKAAAAWHALAQALVTAGFRRTGAFPMRAEGSGGLHSYEGTIKWDAVLVCRKGEPVRFGADLLVAASEVARAKKKAVDYCDNFVSEDEAFSTADMLNLYRALLVAATETCAAEEAILLQEALEAPLLAE